MSATPERWLEVGLRAPEDDPRRPLLAEVLVRFGGRACQEVDGWYVTHVPEPDDPESFLEAVRAAAAAETGLQDVRLRAELQDQEDWAEAWKRGLRPRRITPRLVVTPSWMDPHAGPEDLVIVVDPGMAFGTAEHGTTRGCLRLLDGAVRTGDRVLDVGAGSGILSVAAALLGAAEVLAVEGDPLAEDALRENLAVNGVSDRVRYERTWADVSYLESRGPVDGVVANIEAGVLTPLLPGFARALKPGGWLILSGILDHQWAEVRDAAAMNGFRQEALDEDGEWRSGRFTRVDSEGREGPRRP